MIKNLQLPFQGFDDHDAFQIDPQHATLARNVRSNRARIIRGPGGTLMAPSPLPSVGNPGFGCQAGSFIKATSTGNQTVTHSLGASPAALILFISGASSSGAVTANMRFGIGFTDGTNTRSVSTTDTDAVATNSSTGSLRRFDNAALLTVLSTTAVVSTASFVSFSSSTFVINWTVNDGVAYEISYLIIGQAGMAAKVVQWTLQGTVGSQAIATVGFQPSVVMHITAGGGSGGFPGNASGVGLGFGAMAPGGQFATAIVGGPAGANHSSATLSSASLCLATGAQPATSTPVASASYVSMNANGFTVSIPQAQATQLVASLAISGLSAVKIGSFTETTTSAPVRQAVTGVGFSPKGIMLVAPGSSQASLSFGGIGPSSQFLHAMYENDQGTTTSVASYMRTDQCLADLTMPPTDRTVNILASQFSLDSDGFTLSYSSTSAARTVYYIALNFSSSTGGLTGVIRNYGQVYVGATTAAEKLLMLTNLSAFIYTPGTSSTGVWTPTAEAYTGDVHKRFSIVNTQGIAAWSQGVDNIRQWDGTTFGSLVTSGTNHAARALIAFADRIVSIRPYYGGIDHATQIRWPINGNVNDWSGTGSGSLEIIETSQDPLITGFVLADRAFLCKRREIIELISTGSLTPVFATAPRVRGMGVLAPHSVGLAEQVAFWLGPDDIYMFDGSSLNAIGDRVYNTVTQLIDYSQLDDIQGAVYTPDSLYLLVIPPYLFIYDYRRDIWYQDDVTAFEAIGIFRVGDNFTADIDNSEFPVIGDAFTQTVRIDKQVTSYLGAPIDSYWTSKDFTADEVVVQRANRTTRPSLWDLDSLREVRFQSVPGYLVEVAVSLDRGTTWQGVQTVTVNANGVGVAWFQVPFSQVRFRFRDYGTDSYEIHGQWGIDTEDSGYQLP